MVSKKPTRLYTVGYQGKSLDQLTQLLVENKIQVLADSRQLPWSRKRGFSKNSLKTAVESASVEYVHNSQWGAPKALRNELKSAWNYGEFFEGYGRHLDSLNGNLSKLVELSQGQRVCLLCFEALPEECHRSVLAERLKQQASSKLEIVHL